MATSRKSRHGRTTNEKAGYIAIHSSELLVGVASGSVYAAAATTESLLDTNTSSYSLLIEQEPIAASTFTRVRAQQQYGFAVIVEVDLSVFNAFALEAAHLPLTFSTPIPLAYIQRVIFQSLADLEDFNARASGYADVPLSSLRLEVDQRFFGDGQLSLSPSLSVAQPAQEYILGNRTSPSAQQIGKISGGLATAFFMAKRSGIDQISILFKACKLLEKSENKDSLVAAIASLVDPFINGGSKELAFASELTLTENGHVAGLNVESFLSALRERSDQKIETSLDVSKFCQYATEVINGRRELSTEAFTDAPGKILARALLLFLLNPDPVRLMRIGSRIPSVGQNVHFLSMIFAGISSGLGALDNSIKFPDREFFIGISLLGWRLTLRKPLNLNETKEWNGNGEEVSSLRIDDWRLALITRPIHIGMSSLVAALAKSGTGATFNKDSGELEWLPDETIPGEKMFARVTESQTFPRLDVVEILIRVETKTSARALSKLIQTINLSPKRTSLFASVYALKPKKLIEVSVVIAPINELAAGLSDAMAALTEARKEFLLS